MKIIFLMVNWWLLIPFVILSNISVTIDGKVIHGGIGMIVLFFIFQGIRIIRILRQLPASVSEDDILTFFRADAAHCYFSINDVVSGIQSVSVKRTNKNKDQDERNSAVTSV
jgi:hypothetical protein